jgi:hypothetical protein
MQVAERFGEKSSQIDNFAPLRPLPPGNLREAKERRMGQLTIFDYAALDAETRIVVQQRETELHE